METVAPPQEQIITVGEQDVKILGCVQGSDEWFKARLGKPTASLFDRILTLTGKPSSSSADIINRAVAELIIGEPDETFQSEAMLRGKELEDEALRTVNFICESSFEPCGFMDSMLGYGCSPDAVDLKNNMGLELKCPMAHTHLAYLAEGEVPKKYKQQVQGSLLVSGFETWIFASYHPSFPLFHVEVKRDEAYIDAMRKELFSVCSEIQRKYEIIAQQVGLK